MRAVNRSALVPYSAKQMFDLVADIETYPEFLPWCDSAALIARTASELTASLTMGFGSLNSQFATQNSFAEPDWMNMKLLDGPFSSLEGRWEFEQLNDDGCEVRLAVSFEFDSAVKDMLFGATFETICNELIDAFIKRAHELYGA